MTALETLLDKWMNEPGFKDRFAENQEATVAAAGLTLSGDEWVSLRIAVRGMEDGDLDERFSKGGAMCGG